MTGIVAPPIPEASAVPATHPRFLVVAGDASMGIGVVKVGDDGALTQVPDSPFPTGFGILSLVLAPDGRTVYVPHVGDLAVSGYRLDDDGAPHPIPGATVRSTVLRPPRS
ncbi:hypothetical protein K7711_10565 [Nocardia sp. CA2R105]|uniref:hypothetical protein n=1 Tax=Nocardia coffeae TaxID=2873381 RepID=UPI001CA70FAE|nr:hypothetical protein [Nocardia coffeae]MBY8856919.1 hypothetical protein [Nocardia coffeae]